MSTRWWWWAGLIALALPSLGACGSEEAGVAIEGFQIERADPPLDPTGRLPTVAPGSSVHLSWKLVGRPDRLVLTVDDLPLATWSGGEFPTSFVDRCGTGLCGADTLGEKTYRLTAHGNGKEASRPLTLRVAEHGLRILSFTSQLILPPWGSSQLRVDLNWVTGGAAEVQLSATTIGGGKTRDLGRFTGKEAQTGSFSDTRLQSSTVYRLEAIGLKGAMVSAEIPVTLGDEAYITSLKADPPSVAPGEETTLSWQTRGLERLLIVRDDGGAALPEVKPTELDEGSRKVTLLKGATFTFVGVSTTGDVINQVCDGSGCRPAKISIPLRPSPVVAEFRVDQPEVTFGSTTRLRWNVNHADEVVISWADGAGDHEWRSDQATGSLAIQPGQSTRYTLVARGGGRSASKTTSVIVKPFAELVAEVDPVYGGAYAGEELSVRYSTAGATLLDLAANGRPVPLGDVPPPAGTVRLAIPGDAAEGSPLSLELLARNDETPRKSTRVVVPVTLHRRPGFDRVSFSPSRIQAGAISRLSWQTVDAAGVLLAPPAPTTEWLEPWIELGAGDPAVGGAEIALPFSWNGFGTVKVHENGWISFGTADELEPIRGGAAIAPFMGAFVAGPSSSIRSRSLEGRFVVQWTKLGREGHPGDDLTFQVVLRHDGHAQVSWKTLRLDGGARPQSLATVGISFDVASIGPSLLLWSDRTSRGPEEGSALLFAAGILPASGGLDVKALSSWAPTAWAIGHAAPPVPAVPESLQVDASRDR